MSNPAENVGQIFNDTLPPSISDLELKSHLDNTVTHEYEPNQINQKKYRIITYKNLLVLCIAFLLQFTGFGAIGNLQSSLNYEANVGVNSLSIIYAFLVFSAIFLPHPIISIFGLKWAIVISQVPYLLYVAANLHAKAYLMYPAAALVGLGAAPLWTSKCAYLTETGSNYAKSTNSDKDVVVNRFFGLFFMFFQSSQIWGNLISYLVLKPEEVIDKIGENETNGSVPVVVKYDKCGALFSEKEYSAVEVVNKIDQKTVTLLCIVYIVICACSITIVVIFLDQRRKTSADTIPMMLKKSVKLLVSTVKHLKDFNQILLIPLTMWSGLEQSFLSAQFTKGFVSCAFNAKYVGLILIAYGVCDSIGSLTFGQLVKFFGRIPCFIIAAVCNYTLIIVMLIWKPNENQTYVLFLIAGFWGLSDAVWQTQTNSESCYPYC
ncbi:unnamed protein product [Didymodactylos carnosus]|uniref:UNC93-like protein n=1 Tax=Didymodactylos carnosus TaxID=1234261 RepID=A0A815RP52_9BILA|nr:unnamed protein product [Didymodactylos carnosus]CAF4344976.1 unnamed protein product [Didymodactylos carnosus]